jgi:hypothetical protein
MLPYNRRAEYLRSFYNAMWYMPKSSQCVEKEYFQEVLGFWCYGGGREAVCIVE